MSNQKSVLVTGGSQGIGKAICLSMAKLGYDIHFTYFQEKDLAQKVCKEIEALGRDCFVYRCSFDSQSEVLNLFNEIKNNTQALDALINNAGIAGQASTFEKSDPETWDHVIRVNLLSLFQCTHSALKLIKDGGSIINISSIAADLGSAGDYIWYAASKAGVNAFTKGLASELGPRGIRVNSVMPGLIETKIHEKSGRKDRLQANLNSVPLDRVGQPEEVANCVAFLVSEKASYITGSCIPVTGGR